MSAVPATFQVELPAGGIMHLQSAEEVDLWSRSHQRYIEDYHLTKTNDLVLVGALLQQQVNLFRAQRRLNGMEAEVDNAGVPTGRYKKVDLDSDDVDKAMRSLTAATDQLQKIEKTLGIDKVSRESGGAVSVEQYIRTLTAAAHDRGIHITERTLKYEKFVNALRVKLRIFYNADAEDRAYHDITPEKVMEWCNDELKSLEQVDKDFAKQKGKLYVGQL